MANFFKAREISPRGVFKSKNSLRKSNLYFRLKTASRNSCSRMLFLIYLNAPYRYPIWANSVFSVARIIFAKGLSERIFSASENPSRPGIPISKKKASKSSRALSSSRLYPSTQHLISIYRGKTPAVFPQYSRSSPARNNTQCYYPSPK